ncbi:hypothetical protein KAR91_64980, partial [Candidatus Pacearchaeota archaeon]|nr:hypothetical protein [Candidatus Pacearchaeota archaeon]
MLAIAEGPGGARAIIPVLEYLSIKSVPFMIVDDGFLAEESPKDWNRVSSILEGENSIEELFESKKVKVFLFATSALGSFTLQIARIAKKYSIICVHLLDSWMNYKKRLMLDSEMILPDHYLVMDDLAYEGALTDGLSATLLEIVGQPALASLNTEYRETKLEKRTDGKKLLVFISEPAEADQGAGVESPQYRGYTEKTVLKEFCKRLTPFSDQYFIGIAPHPREDCKELFECWQKYCGTLEGGLLENGGREAVFLADGVAGMASILLYEAWLINKPVISLQPGLCNNDLDFIRKRQGKLCVADHNELESKMKEWLGQVAEPKENISIRDELK